MKVFFKLCVLCVLLCSFFSGCYNETLSDASVKPVPGEYRPVTPTPTEPPSLEDQLASDPLFIEYMDAVIVFNMKFTDKVKNLSKSQLEDYLEDLEDLVENMDEDDEDEVVEKMGFDDMDDYDDTIDDLRYYKNALFQKYPVLSSMSASQRAVLYRSVLIRVEVKAIFIARFEAGVYAGKYNDCWFICFWWEYYVYIFVEIIIEIEITECLIITTPHWRIVQCTTLSLVVIIQYEFELYWLFIYCIIWCPVTPTPTPTPPPTSLPTPAPTATQKE